jgi:nitrous oxide reductase accessory protein NosL
MRLLTSIVFSMLVLACSSAPAEPVTPVWGKQACDHCMMLVSERRSAAQLMLPSGSRKFFDDVGCLAAWLDESGQVPHKAWVRAPIGDAWIDAFAAHYSGGNRTPMDYGFLPSAQGISFQELRSVLQERSAQRREEQP